MVKFMLSSDPSFPLFDSRRWAKNNSTMAPILYHDAQMHVQLHYERTHIQTHPLKHTHGATQDE